MDKSRGLWRFVRRFNLLLQDGWRIGFLFWLLLFNAADAHKCDTCRFLIESFKYGLSETAKSHYAGGDAAWEAEKLGKYARSETRLVEILDEFACKKSDQVTEALKAVGLGDTKDNGEHRCHAFVEEHEETIENWYFHKQSGFPDLFQWLCMDTLKLCCPQFTYGPQCLPCQGDPQRPCFGNGKCDGAGTREGTGKCKCDSGYSGNLCRKCAYNYYAVQQNDTHVTCAKCDTSCKGGCTGDGPGKCNSCKTGYEWRDHVGCKDVDECLTSPCADGIETCVNSVGSYECNCIEGYTKQSGKCIVDVMAREPETYYMMGLLTGEQFLRATSGAGLLLALALIIHRRSLGLGCLFLVTLCLIWFIEFGPGAQMIAKLAKPPKLAPPSYRPRAA